ncbi:type II secretion system F family protein [Cellulosimicrobium arenosum]|uniref:Type II secretion system F family protein n=1 Tax=Cellulosimicrobium arenosum TaxID=2708133 RepID=A0A927G7N0_9MICO|nr:type II secretion system F family protein [Cellulosimicrobium arenosum]MBD8078049.1 type II secretion system F family protein [Cellulosimicrobium arenosum]
MIGVSWVGVTIGALAGIGVLLVVAGLRGRAISLDERLAPYLRERDATSTLLRDQPVHTPFPTLERLVAPWVGDAGRALERFGSTRSELSRTLQRAGRSDTVEQFRARQLVWGVLGLAAGTSFAVLLAATRGSSVVSLVLLAVVCGVGGDLACDQMLGRAARRRESRMLAEFPTVAELLALAVGAGEGPVAALERVATTARGELSGELAATLASVRSGVPLTRALEDLADRTALASLTRFAEGVAVAVERGTPLADVLRSQAQDVRESGRRALMEEGGRKEVLMMVPVVFLILPVTVVFAVFPSIATLRIGF